MSIRLTQEVYERRVRLLGISVLGKYQGRKKSILHLCRCGREWESSPDNVLSGNKCPKCKREQMQAKFTKTKDQYEIELQSLGVKLTSEYVNSHTKTDHICICGRVFIAAPHRILQGDKCGICTKNKDKLITHQNYLDQLSGREIKVTPLEKYVSMRTKIKHRCICGNEWDTNPSNVLNSWLCGCERSRGEIEIRDWLTEKGIEYKQEFSFPDLKCQRLLRYDFALFHSGQLNSLIEFHGEQHFNHQRSSWFKTEDDFKKLQFRDKMKRDYAKRNGIKLIEIRFDQVVCDELEKALNSEVIS